MKHRGSYPFALGTLIVGSSLERVLVPGDALSNVTLSLKDL